MNKRTIGTVMLFLLFLLTVVALYRTPMTPVGSAAANNNIDGVKSLTK